tara:strand:+ start:2984 stop:3406 length:423 start_codon:yes stop_codon:yes gene_type:complete
MKLFLQPNGSVWAVGMQSSDPQKIEQQVWSFFSHGAIDSADDVTNLSEKFSYVWTDRPRLEKYFYNSSFAMVFNEEPVNVNATPADNLGNGARLYHKIKNLAEKRMEELLENTDRWWRPADPNEVYSLGTISAEKPDKDS